MNYNTCSGVRILFRVQLIPYDVTNSICSVKTVVLIDSNDDYPGEANGKSTCLDIPYLI